MYETQLVTNSLDMLCRSTMACLSTRYSYLEEGDTWDDSCWIECLPLELLSKVFLYLTKNELKAAMLVCKRWREAVGSLGKLWSSTSLQISSHNISPVSTLLSSGMLCRLQRVKVEKISEQILEAMVAHEGLKEVDFSGSDLSGFNATLLASLVERLERVNLRKTRLTRNQLDVLFDRLGERRSRLKSLNIEKNDLSSTPPAQLASAVRGLKELWMSRSRTTAEQQLILAVHSLGDDTPLNLNMEWGTAEGHPTFLWCFNLVHENPSNLLAVADILRRDKLWTLDSLVVNNAPIGSLTTGLFELLINYANIKLLDLSYSSLVLVDPELLASLVTQAIKVDLSGSDLTKKQLRVLLLRVSQEETPLQRLDLGENNMSSVEPALLSSALTRLTHVGLGFCDLSTTQLETFLASLSQDESSSIQHLSLSDNYLTSVDPALIGQSIVGLKTANLCGTKLTLRQISAALALIIHSNTLEYIMIDVYRGLDYQDGGAYQGYLNHQEYLDFKDLIQEARNKMTVTEISKKQRRTEFFSNGARLLKLLNECSL